MERTLVNYEKVILEGSVNDIFKTTSKWNAPCTNSCLRSCRKRKKQQPLLNLAYDWAYRNPGLAALGDLPLLFILKLRKCPPGSFIRAKQYLSELLSDVDRRFDFITRKTSLESNQKLCWVILDGLDEYSGSLVPSDDTQGSNIVPILQFKSLREVRVSSYKPTACWNWFTARRYSELLYKNGNRGIFNRQLTWIY